MKIVDSVSGDGWSRNQGLEVSQAVESTRAPMTRMAVIIRMVG
jgi:hypothetical protein